MTASSLGRIGLKIVLISVITTAFAVAFGIGIGHLMNPGKGVAPQTNSTPSNLEVGSINFRNFILNIVPENVIESFSQGNLLQIVFFSIFTGKVISQFKNKSEKNLTKNPMKNSRTPCSLHMDI